MAEREGFEPPVPFGITSFQDWRLQPLGHLSAFRGGLKRLNIITFFSGFVKHYFRINPTGRTAAAEYRKPAGDGRPTAGFLRICQMPRELSSEPLSCTPTVRAASWPFLNRIRQGMLEMP